MSSSSDEALVFPEGITTGVPFASCEEAAAWLSSACEGVFGPMGVVEDFRWDPVGLFESRIAAPYAKEYADEWTEPPPRGSMPGSVGGTYIRCRLWSLAPIATPRMMHDPNVPQNDTYQEETRVKWVTVRDVYVWLRTCLGSEIRLRAIFTAAPVGVQRRAAAKALGDVERAVDTAKTDFVDRSNRWVYGVWLGACDTIPERTIPNPFQDNSLTRPRGESFRLAPPPPVGST